MPFKSVLKNIFTSVSNFYEDHKVSVLPGLIGGVPAIVAAQKFLIDANYYNTDGNLFTDHFSNGLLSSNGTALGAAIGFGIGSSIVNGILSSSEKEVPVLQEISKFLYTTAFVIPSFMAFGAVIGATYPYTLPVIASGVVGTALAYPIANKITPALESFMSKKGPSPK